MLNVLIGLGVLFFIVLVVALAKKK